MAQNFLQSAGTDGFLTTPISLMTTELNSLASGAAVISSVNGTSGKFNQSSLGNAILGTAFFTAGGAFTPVVGGHLLVWLLPSPDGGTNFESNIATASTTVPALPRAADFIIPLDNAALASGNIKAAQPRKFQLPAETFKVLVQNNSGVALPSSGNTLTCGSVVQQAV